MEIIQKQDILYTLTVDEEAYRTIKVALRYSAEASPEKLRGRASELLSIFPPKCFNGNE